MTRVLVEPKSCDQGRRKNDALGYFAKKKLICGYSIEEEIFQQLILLYESSFIPSQGTDFMPPAHTS